MANANVMPVGQVNQAGAADALFYKVFTGEVLTAYDQATIMESRHRVRNIQGQKSAGFNNIGRAVGRYHTPGTEITGQGMNFGETVISVDDLLIADAFIGDLDTAKNHYDERSEIAKQLGKALGRTFDKQTMRVAIQAARASNVISGLPGGTTITLSGGYAGATDANKAIELADALFAAHQAAQENECDTDGIFAALKPADYFRLVRNKDLLNVDWGGLGSYARAELPMVGGIPLVVSNFVPQQDDAANTSGGVTTDGGDVIDSSYADDYSKVQSFIMTPRAIGTVKLIDMQLKSYEDGRRQGELLVARTACGHGILRPEDAFEIVIP